MTDVRKIHLCVPEEQEQVVPEGANVRIDRAGLSQGR
jgi:hypothetical protein